MGVGVGRTFLRKGPEIRDRRVLEFVIGYQPTRTIGRDFSGIYSENGTLN